ncbi:YcxB family protein [Epilithonimonas pallida]|uniref:YcxB-like protein n=1 Tax=Epilithonimonas pallida TaxID=373671 RepID=A0ABY1R7L1_9FLAO|nr:YcxB family protein [Epilithonimonas pallida]SMP97300.1 YcxB-like protein [Epilithonimonas pallida]
MNLNLNYSLNEKDYLIYQLYTASKSKNVIKQKRKSFIIVFIAFTFFGVNIYNKDKSGLWFFIPICLIILMSYPFILKWRYKSHYKKFIQENYKERIGLISNYNFDTETLNIKNSLGESKINYESFEQINETNDYYYLKLKTEESFIIPKSQILSNVEFKQILNILKEKYAVKENIELDWKY